MKKLKLLLGLLTIAILTPTNINAMENSTSENIIKSMVNAIQEKDWTDFTSLVSSDQQYYYETYFSDDTNKNGIKQIESISLESITYAKSEIAQYSWLTTEYALLDNSEHIDSNNIETYIVGLNCTVSEENQYFYNGLNYFTIVLAQENDEMKIVQFNRPCTEIIEEVIIPEISTTDVNYKDEISAINVIKNAEQGYLVNADGESIENGFKSVQVEHEQIDNVATVLSNNYSEHKALGTYTNYSIPSSIRVLMNKTGDGSVSPVAFMSYVKCTVPNEWFASWSDSSLIAGIYCVKGVGLYRSISPVNSALGYDVSQGTQLYKPGTSDSNVNTLAENLRYYFVVNSSNKIFYPEYGQGVLNDPGTSSSGRLLQYGSQYLASSKGYSAYAILNYYYGASDCSSGNIQLVTIQ